MQKKAAKNMGPRQRVTRVAVGPALRLTGRRQFPSPEFYAFFFSTILLRRMVSTAAAAHRPRPIRSVDVPG